MVVARTDNGTPRGRADREERAARMATNFDVTDLRRLVERPPPFATVMLGAPTDQPDSGHRFEVAWRNARRSIEKAWHRPALGLLDGAVERLRVGEEPGAVGTFLVVQSADGTIHIEPLHYGRPGGAAGTVGELAVVAPLPRLAPVIASRQRAVPYIVVVTDRTGADVLGFAGGRVVAADDVRGDTEYIHRAQPGGWSQPRYQRRAENTWERNAGEVAAEVSSMGAELHPMLIAVTGDVRATTFLVDQLGTHTAERVEVLAAGEPEGIRAEVDRLLDDYHDQLEAAVLDELEEGLAHGWAVAGRDTFEALRDGRVATLLVYDDGGDQPTVPAPAGRTSRDAVRVVDRAIEMALRTDAGVFETSGPLGDGQIAALLRW